MGGKKKWQNGNKREIGGKKKQTIQNHQKKKQKA